MLTAAQIADRRLGIGGSDVAAILGVSPYRTPLDVYREKVGEVEPPDLSDREAVRWGTILEDVIADEYAHRTGVKVRRRTQTVVHPAIRYLRGHLDREVVGQRKVLEVKTAGFWAGRELGEAGTDAVPDAWLLQVTHYMLVTGFRQADIAALVGGQELRVYPVQFDQALADEILTRCGRFWHNHVEKRIPPPPQTAGDLKALYPTDDGGAVEATVEVEAAVADLRETVASIKALEGRRTALEVAIKAHIGEAATLTDLNGRALATWKTQTATRLDSARLKAEDPGLFARFAVTSTSRVLRLPGGAK